MTIESKIEFANVEKDQIEQFLKGWLVGKFGEQNKFRVGCGVNVETEEFIPSITVFGNDKTPDDLEDQITDVLKKHKPNSRFVIGRRQPFL